MRTSCVSNISLICNPAANVIPTSTENLVVLFEQLAVRSQRRPRKAKHTRITESVQQ